METKKFLNLGLLSQLTKSGNSNGEPVAKYFIISLSSLVTTGAFLGIFWSKLPPEVPLFYSKPWGEPQLAKPYFLVAPLLMGVLFLAVNLSLAERTDNYSFLRKSLLFGTTIISILASIAVIRIVLLIV